MDKNIAWFSRVFVGIILLTFIFLIFTAATEGWWISTLVNRTTVRQYRQQYGTHYGGNNKSYRHHNSGRSYRGGSRSGGGK